MTFWSRVNNLFHKDLKGTDYSSDYIKHKNAFFYIAREDEQDEGLIVFKPFLVDMSYDLKLNTKDNLEAISLANPSKIITDSTLDLKVSLNVPAVSVSESKANREKISKLLTWLKDPQKVPTRVSSKKATTNIKCNQIMNEMYKAGYTINNKKWVNSKDPTAFEALKEGRPQYHANALACLARLSKQDPKPKPKAPTADEGKYMVFRISFANLIQSGKYNEFHEILNSKSSVTATNMGLYGLRCFISNINVEVDIEMGYFEDSGAIPKAYKLSMDISILNELEKGGDSNMQNLLGFGKTSESKTNKYQKNPPYHDNDIKYWPFGVKTKGKVSQSSTMEFSYASNKEMSIEFEKYGIAVSFLPMINKFSIKRAMDQKYMQEFKHLTGVDRIVYDTKAPTFDISFVASAINLSHAKTILFNLQQLLRMIAPEYQHQSTSIARLNVSVGNLIGAGTEFFNFENRVECICSNLSLKPNIEMGFFEQNGMLYPKNFEISLSLEVVDSSFGA